ncbi:ArsR family transcriptional regulator [Streptomyces sioyaensis]|uniref:ArsR family transcriptional regulator n=1 Tax=Streptomyces sioyaensis TaxID=67364 RepID=A0A4Q1RCP1_9ACTN|nr:ArsR family transcriptional regulator [Streptomyces sioyaensis]MBM4796670.1 ArsR family transcriptional regulator [Streptomyces sioyaensis]RXS71579.1 ArsR family transcriptional regulator [Streptomyces sioyaensis]
MSPSDATAHPAKPDQLFDRDVEWADLVGFVCDPRPGATLGLVSGRRRQGKTFLLEAIAKAADGFYFDGHAAAEAETLHRLAERFGEHTRATHPPHWQRWEDAVDALLALGDQHPTPVIIDNFPDLVGPSPALPSVIHRAYRRLHQVRRHNRARLILSGGTPSLMRRLFSGPSSLHRIASLELLVRPFDFREAARFWGIRSPQLAVQVHAVVGGTPAYRGDLVCDDAPAGPHDFDAWVCRTVLNPRVPLFWEARNLLEEENHADRALSHSALVAIAAGRSTPGEIAECFGAQLTDVSHVLAVLQNRGLLHAEPDAFRPALTRYRIAEPLLAFEHAVAWPHRAAIEQGDTATVWQHARATFDSAVAAPRFAQICRDWATAYAGPGTFEGDPETAVRGAVSGPVGSTRLDVDVAVRGNVDGRPGALLSVGLARWNETMDIHHLERLRHILSVLSTSGEDVGGAVPACYSGGGFGPELRAAEARGEVLLVDVDRLYHGE